jgi:hypothetical protein
MLDFWGQVGQESYLQPAILEAIRRATPVRRVSQPSVSPERPYVRCRAVPRCAVGVGGRTGGLSSLQKSHASLGYLTREIRHKQLPLGAPPSVTDSRQS